MIRLDGVSVTLGRREILHSIGFTAEKGAVTVIAGPNGSGKSTALKTIAGELPFTGTLTFDGVPLGRLGPHQLARRRGVLPQASAVAFPFTVSEIVRLGLAAGGLTRAGEAEARIAAALARVDLSGFGPRLYPALSGGEQQRVQLARVLAQLDAAASHGGSGDAGWLLLDEPVASLDIRHQLAVMALARDFARAGGGVIAVMHDLNLTALYGDRLVLMQSGRVMAEGSIAEAMTDETLSDVFGCPLRVIAVPGDGKPFVLAHSSL